MDRQTDEKYKQICEKLGFVPSEYAPDVPSCEDDTRNNPFSILETDELLYLIDNGYLSK